MLSTWGGGIITDEAPETKTKIKKVISYLSIGRWQKPDVDPDNMTPEPLSDMAFVYLFILK